MTNLEKIIEMRKKVDEMSVEVAKNINVQTEIIKRCRQERAIEMYEFFEGLHTAIDAKNTFGLGKESFTWSPPFEGQDGHRPILCIHEVGTEFRVTKLYDVTCWRLNKEGKNSKRIRVCGRRMDRRV